MFRELGSLQTKSPSSDQTWEFALTKVAYFLEKTTRPGDLS